MGSSVYGMTEDFQREDGEMSMTGADWYWKMHRRQSGVFLSKSGDEM